MSESAQPNQKPGICFVAPYAYNVLSGKKNVNHTGGAEVQQLQIASWLVRKGYSVSFVTLDYGQPDGVEINGVEVFNAYAQADGVRGLRFVHPRWSGLWAAMARANADVYYQRGAEYETGQVGLWCRLHRRPFIFAVANDSDCDASLHALTSRADRWFYRLGLRLADAVTAQTMTQQTLLRKNMGVEAVVVRNCGEPSINPSGCERLTASTGKSIHVLWVGRISEQKRFEWLLDVAEKCPDISFEVVGAPNVDSLYASSLLERASGIPCVKMRGWVPYAEMVKYYQHCHILCCTSAYEGFPNTFLEAWRLGIPVVSTFDPDGAIAKNGLGWVAHDVEGIVACIREISKSPETWRKAVQAARRYHQATHTADVCLPILEQLILDLVGDEAACELRGGTNSQV